MDNDKFEPVPHDADFDARIFSRKGVKSAYDVLEEEYATLNALLRARKASGLTQDEIARRMGTTKSAVSRLEASFGNAKHSPSFATLRKYAAALGKRVEVRLV
jgi:DNA-binding XRE family transcriptional regulator